MLDKELIGVPDEREAQRVYFNWVDRQLRQARSPAGALSINEDADGRYASYLSQDQKTSIIRARLHKRARAVVEVQLYESWFVLLDDDTWEIDAHQASQVVLAFIRAPQQPTRLGAPTWSSAAHATGLQPWIAYLLLYILDSNSLWLGRGPCPSLGLFSTPSIRVGIPSSLKEAMGFRRISSLSLGVGHARRLWG